MKNICKIWIKYIQEGCAIGALRVGMMGPIAKILICDDSPQFKEILALLSLCWIHEIRPYKKLMPIHPDFVKYQTDFLDKVWNFF